MAVRSRSNGSTKGSSGRADASSRGMAAGHVTAMSAPVGDKWAFVRRRPYTPPMPDAAALAAFEQQVSGCTRCRLAQGRTQVVFGVGNPHADLMFVGEAPGFHEDKQGYPFVGQAGKLLDRLLGGIGLERSQVYIANVLKCRPPGNRDPQPDEIEACESHLFRQIELIEPTVVATLGNFATPAMLKVLEEDFARLSGILGRTPEPPAESEPQFEPEPLVQEPTVQLGLF